MKKSESFPKDAQILIEKCNFASEAIIKHKRCEDLRTEKGKARCSAEEAWVPAAEEGMMCCGAKAVKVCDSGHERLVVLVGIKMDGNQDG